MLCRQLWRFWDFFKLKKYFCGDFLFTEQQGTCIPFSKNNSPNGENSPPKNQIHWVK
jgi:hypothetical protein